MDKNVIVLGSNYNLIIENRDPTEKDLVYRKFWLNYLTKELFEVISNKWVSLSKAYVVILSETKML